MYISNGAMFRVDWSEKPNYHAYTDLVFNQWWTEEEGLVNDKGEFKVRGFLGDYEITASRNGLSSTQEAVLVKDGTAITMVLTDPTSNIGEFVDNNESFQLGAGYPNPFNTHIVFPYTIPEPSEVHITVRNILGIPVWSTVLKSCQPGKHTITWNGRDNGSHVVENGMYFMHLEAISKSGRYYDTQKILLLK